ESLELERTEKKNSLPSSSDKLSTDEGKNCREAPDSLSHLSLSRTKATDRKQRGKEIFAEEVPASFSLGRATEQGRKKIL
ncbi:unnamed protein product, partial [Coffea canephora]